MVLNSSRTSCLALESYLFANIRSMLAQLSWPIRIGCRTNLKHYRATPFGIFCSTILLELRPNCKGSRNSFGGGASSHQIFLKTFFSMVCSFELFTNVQVCAFSLCSVWMDCCWHVTLRWMGGICRRILCRRCWELASQGILCAWWRLWMARRLNWIRMLCYIRTVVVICSTSPCIS